MQGLSAIGSLTAHGFSGIASGMASKPAALTVLALLVLSSIPTVSAGTATYAKCFKACMDGCGNAALVCFPICGAACTVTLPF
jgi:hypothetical protein